MLHYHPVWSSPPDKPALAPDEVHIWRATIEISTTKLAHAQRLLAADEKARANRFRFESDRHHFVVARALLRVILSWYLDCAPDELQFTYSDFGKPSLAGPYADSGLNFNLAHSDALALYAVTIRRAIGVDIEQIRKEFEVGQIAQHFFSPREVEQLRSLPATARAKAFFDCWTRKEAFIKAKGLGLSLPLDQFDVSLAPGEPVCLLRTRGDTNESARWALRAIHVNPDYAAAVAVEGNQWRASYWEVSNDDLFE